MKYHRNTCFDFPNIFCCFQVFIENFTLTMYAGKRPARAHDAGKGFRARQKPRYGVCADKDIVSVGARGSRHGQLCALWREGRGDPCLVVEKVQFVHRCFLSLRSVNPQEAVLVGPERERVDLFDEVHHLGGGQLAV